MPRDSAGNYSLVAGNPVQSGEVVSSSWANNTLDDVAVALSDSLDRNGRGGMLAPFRFSDGTNLLPGAAWVNETTTGFYRFDGGDLRLAVLTQDVMRWQTSGVQIWNNTDLIWQNVLTDGGGGAQVPVNVGTADGQTLRWEADDSEWQPSNVLSVLDTNHVNVGANLSDYSTLNVEVNDVGNVTDALALINRLPATGSGSALDFCTNFDQPITARINSEEVQPFSADIVFHTRDGNLTTSPITERMRIQSNGQVGINIATPTGRLHVAESGAAGEAAGTIKDTALLTSYTTPNEDSWRFYSRSLGSTSDWTGEILQFGRFVDGTHIASMSVSPQFSLDFHTGGGAGDDEGVRMRIDSAGRVGIAETAPSAVLTVNGSTQITGGTFPTGAAGLEFTYSGSESYIQSFNRTSGEWLTTKYGALGHIFSANGTEAFRIHTSGNVGIGNSPADLGQMLVIDGLSQNKPAQAVARGNGVPNAQNGWFCNDTNHGVYMETDGAGGPINILVFKEFGGRFDFRNSANTNLCIIQTPLGTGTVYSNGAILTNTNPSDMHMKENIVPIPHGLDAVMALNPVQFEWAPESHKDGKIHFGMLAQEVEGVIPEIFEREDEHCGLRSEELVPVLVKAVQELTARLEALEGA